MSNTPRRALLVIDVQNAYVSGNFQIEHPPVAQSLPNIGRAMDAAREAGIPVVVVQHNGFGQGSDDWQLHPLVASRAHDHRIDKPSDVLAEGDKVDVKITDVDMENKKISLSIRALLEEQGQDEE